MITRFDYLNKIKTYFEIFPICGLLGPRQCGKTTLAQQYSRQKTYSYFDLENPSDMNKLINPTTIFDASENLIIIDEVQREPNLFPLLRSYSDQNNHKKFLLLGSSSPDLLRQSAESLAGRIGYIDLSPLSIDEVGFSDTLWLRGGFPKSYLAKTDEKSWVWRDQYIRTFLERDLALMGFNMNPQAMRRFWIMTAHYQGNLVNYSELGRSIGVSDTTIRRYLDILENTFMTWQLKPWFENIGKRQVKNPKLYIRDSGIFHSLMGLREKETIFTHPKLGASWEGFALEQVVQALKVDRNDCYFWRTQTGVELDLLLYQNGIKMGYEFKFSETPKVTKSMRVALDDLNLEHLTIVTHQGESYPLDEKISVQPLHAFVKKNRPS